MLKKYQRLCLRFIKENSVEFKIFNHFNLYNKNLPSLSVNGVFNLMGFLGLRNQFDYFIVHEIKKDFITFFNKLPINEKKDFDFNKLKKINSLNIDSTFIIIRTLLKDEKLHRESYYYMDFLRFINYLR